jgi:hypothetical protein
MSRADYAHWNEDQDLMWWHEEGKHETGEPEYDPDDYLPQEPEIHDTTDECIADGNMSTSDNIVWRCDHECDNGRFISGPDGKMIILHDVEVPT